MTLYAVGDIHGQREMLEHALELIEADGGAEARVVFLGDLVDRGPDARGVVQMLIDGQAAGRDWTVVRGNHDQLFLEFLEDGRIWFERIRSGISWLNPRMGGNTTLASYGVEASEDAPNRAASRAAVPQAHTDFIRGLPWYLETGDLLFVHAGIDPGVPLPSQDKQDLIWIRDPFLTCLEPHPWLIVHGHTPGTHPEHFGNRVNLDGGAGYGRPLVPAVFEGRQAWLLTDKGRVSLSP